MAYLKEIEIRYKRKAVDSDIIGETAIGPEQIVSLFRDLQNETKEKFIIINLDGKSKIACFEVVAIGSVNSIMLRPMEVFRTSIIINAAAAIVVHNHPSGDPEPSPQDIEFTKKLLRLSKDLGLRLLDHIIIGFEGHYSFNDKGLLHEMKNE